MVNLSAASRTNRSRSVVVSPDEQHGFGVKYWEIIADNLKKRGWSYGYVSAIDSQGRTIWIVDAHRGDGQRFVVHADEKLTAFMELESAIRAGELPWLAKERAGRKSPHAGSLDSYFIM